MPVLRVCVLSWQPRMVGPMVDCVEVWAPLLPLWTLDHLLEQLIFPRLQREVRPIYTHSHSHTHSLTSTVSNVDTDVSSYVDITYSDTQF